MRRYTVRRAASVTRDMAAICKHLVRSYQEFGETKAAAARRAAARIRESFEYMRSFAAHPHRGTVHPDLRGGIRHVTERQFVYDFEIDDACSQVTILAVFFGGQDHLEQIMALLRH